MRENIGDKNINKQRFIEKTEKVTRLYRKMKIREREIYKDNHQIITLKLFSKVIYCFWAAE